MATSNDPRGSDFWLDFECRANPVDTGACANLADLRSDYSYLLGLYLGDGYLVQAAKAVWKLRIFQDSRYSALIDLCDVTIKAVADRKAGFVRRPGCTEIYSNWKHWICLFPQHGPGPKHLRTLRLHEWQQRIVDHYPRELIRGLIDSDGSRCINRVHRPTKKGRKEYLYVRYFFTSASGDIRGMFVAACDKVGVEWRRMTERDISIAKRSGVALLDTFVGPKR